MADTATLGQELATLCDRHPEFAPIGPLATVAEVSVLLARGANVDAVDSASSSARATPQVGYPALVNAALRGNVEVVRLLLDRGANLEASNKVRRGAAPTATE
jgi:hypothetical protein